LDGAQDAHVGAATTEMSGEFSADLAVTGLRIPLQQGLRPHHDAGNAVAALRGLLLDEGALDCRRLRRRAQAFERRHLLALHQHPRRHGGEYSLAVDDDRARAALSEPATIFGGVELELIAQDIEQRRVRLGGDVVVATIDLQFHGWPRWEVSARIF